MNYIASIATSLAGHDNEYRKLHRWVERQLGKPNLCVICGTTQAKRFHWANISREYNKNISDWRRLCVSCHKREDYLGYCKYGHEMTVENTYTYPKGYKVCRTCRIGSSSRSPKEQRTCERCNFRFECHRWQPSRFCSKKCAKNLGESNG